MSVITPVKPVEKYSTYLGMNAAHLRLLIFFFYLTVLFVALKICTTSNFNEINTKVVHNFKTNMDFFLNQTGTNYMQPHYDKTSFRANCNFTTNFGNLKDTTFKLPRKSNMKF